MSDLGNEYIPPQQWAQQGRVLRASFSLSNMQRLLSATLGVEGDAEVDLAFSLDEERRAVIRGSVTASVRLQCQRCLSEMAMALTTRTCLVVVSDDRARMLPEACDPLLVTEEKVNLLEVVEDELLLVLPPFPVHEADECQAPGFAEGSSDEAPQRENPFAVLAELKDRPH